MAVTPIRPDQASELRRNSLPDSVIECWNNLIAQNLVGSVAKVLQDDAISAICAKTGVTRADVFKNRWLDIESVYEYYGWNVEYDKPVSWGGDNYAASFKFSTKI